MAAKAEPKRRRAAKAAKDGAAQAKGAKAPRGKRAKAGTANGEREDMAPSNVTKATVEEHARKIFAQQARVTEAAEELKSIRADLSAYYKSAKGDGVNIDAIKSVGKMRKRDASEIRTEQRDIRRYLSVLAPSHAKQLDMFVNWGGAVSDPDAEGFAAFKNSEPVSNNPYQAGSEDAQKWDGGWHRGEEAVIRGMGSGASASAAAGPLN